MKTSTLNPKIHKILRYLSAYTLFVVFILFGLLITWGLRSDVFIFCMVFSLPKWLISIVYTWGTYLVFLPYILGIGFLESYMNQAAAKNLLRERTLKVLVIEGGIGLFVFIIMGVLALLGYPPTL